MTWELWPKAEPMRLAYYVNPDALHWFDGAINYDDFIGQTDGIYQIVQAIYNTLREREKPINYAPEKYHYLEPFQEIRSPKEVLGDNSPMGTCLDLALVFCGLCLAHDLLPYLIVLDGHALAAVSLKNTRREWEKNRAGRSQFDSEGSLERGLLTAQQPEQLEQFYQLIEHRTLLPIECTGFAHSQRLGKQPSFPEGVDRQDDGSLTFERAVQAGREQLKLEKNPFQFALDIAIAQAYIEKPYSLDQPREHVQALWNVPYPRNPFFTGRGDTLSDLHELLSTNKLAVLNGLGGLGKTHTAIEYAYRYQSDYEAIFWARADSFETFTSDLMKVVRGLDLPEKGSHDQERIVNAFKSWLRGTSNWLLILDNVEEFVLVKELLPLAGRGCILLTTRSQATRSLAQPIPLKSMEPDDGALFLLRRADLIAQDAPLETASPTEVMAAREISETLGGLPLALDQVGAYIEETQCGLSDYQERYRTQRLEVLNKRGGLLNDHPESVATTLSLSFQKVEQKNPTAVALLRFCAFLHPDAIPEEIITTGAKPSGPPLQIVADQPLDLDNAMRILRTYSLIDRDAREKTLGIHRLAQAVLIDSMDEASIKQWIERTVKSLNALFPRVEYANWSFCKRLLPHTLVCADFIKRYEIVLPQAAHLLNHAGYYVFEQAGYKEAERLLEQALCIQRKLEPDHPDEKEILNGKVQILNDLGLLYCRQHKGEQAEPLLQEALRIQEQLNDPNPGQSLWILGLACYYQNKNEQAEECYQRALAIRRERFELDDYRIGTVLQNLALLYERQGKYKQAEEYYQDALKLFEHRELDQARTLECFAGLYRKQGKYEEAKELCLQALTINEQYLGSEHSRIAMNIINLATLYQEQGKYQEAELLYQRVLAIYELHSETEKLDIVRILHLLATLYQEQERYQEAEALYQQALAIGEQHLQQEDNVIAISLLNLATLYQEQGRHQEAEPLFQRALAICELRSEPEYHDITRILHLLARLYREQKKYQEAEALYQRAIAISEQHLQQEDGQIAVELNNLAVLYHEQKKYQEAEPLYQRALAIDEQHLGLENNSLNFAINLSNLAGLYEDLGNYQQAKQFYHRALQIRRQVLGEEHPTTVETRQRYYSLIKADQERENDLPEILQPNHPKTEEGQEIYLQE